jgi:HEAT repeat protein
VAELAERRLPEAVAPLIERLQDPDPGIARLAVGALIAIGDRRAVPPLIELTRKRPGEFVSQVVYALGELGGEEAEGFLFTLESGHPDATVRKAAAQALSDMQRRREEVHR